MILTLLLLAMSPADTTMTPLQRLLHDDWQYRMEQNPEWASFLGDHRYGDRLTDLSPTAIHARQEHDRVMLARARALKPASSSSGRLRRLFEAWVRKPRHGPR